MKYGSIGYSSKLANLGKDTKKVASKEERRRRVSATLFNVSDLCLITKVNCWMYAIQDAWRAKTLSYIPKCSRVS